MTQAKLRCAIYTRKSSDEGSDQNFNSLDAQREACEAYITSQRHEGWHALKTRYDDGGVSGGTLERPGLQRLMTDIDDRRIDMVVVYKIDRLTRSLADFAKLLERLDAANCSFVSVTQAFNTSSSMGRLTLNVLLSFAQFEREVTAERIRDKIAASKKKGLWMGGLAPLGYDPHPDKTKRSLVVNEAEAHTVRALFQLYLEEGGLNATKLAADARGLRSKVRRRRDGTISGGTLFSRGQIHHILGNPFYRGMIRHKDKVWPGLHDAIVDDALWEAVQNLLALNATHRGASKAGGATQQAALIGKLYDETGEVLTPSHTKRGQVLHRYYVSNRLLHGTKDPTGWRLPARQIEKAVAHAVAAHLDSNAQQIGLETGDGITEVQAIAEGLEDFAACIRTDGIGDAVQCVARVDLTTSAMTIRLSATALAHRAQFPSTKLDQAHVAFQVPMGLRRRGHELKLVTDAIEPAPDQVLIDGLRRAHRWADRLKSGEPLRRIAESRGASERYTSCVIALSTLAPDIQRAIIEGRQPTELTLKALVKLDLPINWQDQSAALGLE